MEKSSLNASDDNDLKDLIGIDHEMLATKCLDILSAEGGLSIDLCDLRQPGASRAEIGQETIDAKLSHEIQCACLNWVFHWKATGRRILDGGPVDAFLRQHLLHWLEALSLLGQIHEVDVLIEDLLGLIEGPEISTLLDNLHYFIRLHRRVLDSHPLQIYPSAIAFAPSKLRHVFQDSCPAWLVQCTQLEWLDRITSMAFSPDSQRLASVSYRKPVILWDAVTGAHLKTLEGHSEDVTSIAFSPDSQTLATVSEDKTVRIWDVVTGACMRTLGGHSHFITSATFSPDSQRLATVSKDKVVKVWDAVTGACLQKLESRYSFTSVAFSSDSRRLVTSSKKTLSIWDAATGTCLKTLIAHDHDHVFSVAFSPDSQTLAVASDEKISILDLTTGHCLKTFKHYHPTIWSSIEATNPLLHTDLGSFQLSMFADPEMRAERKGIGFSQDFSWMTCNGDNILSLPLIYQPETCAMSQCKVALASQLGLLLIVEISPTHLPALVKATSSLGE